MTDVTCETLLPVASSQEIRHLVEHDLREELLAATGLVPLSWLMIGQWARVPEH